MVVALILENPRDDRIEKFKIKIKGNLFSKGSLSEAMEELGKQKSEKIRHELETAPYGFTPLLCKLPAE